MYPAILQVSYNFKIFFPWITFRVTNLNIIYQWECLHFSYLYPFYFIYLSIFCDISLTKISRTAFVDYSLFGTMFGIVLSYIAYNIFMYVPFVNSWICRFYHGGLLDFFQGHFCIYWYEYQYLSLKYWCCKVRVFICTCQNIYVPLKKE